MHRLVLLGFFLIQILLFKHSFADIVNLDPDNFHKKVTKSESIWLVAFYDNQSSDYHKFKSDFQSIASALKGVVKVGAVDSKYEKLLSDNNIPNVKDNAVLKIFCDKKSKVYKGGKTKEELVEHMLSVVDELIRKRANLKLKEKSKPKSKPASDDNESAVIELTDDNFDKLVLKSGEMWLVEFFAPWCGHCQQLKPQWEEAAKNLRGVIKMGALDATVHSRKAQEYFIRGYPTIKLFNNGRVEEYSGGRSAADITNWVMNIVPSEPVKIEQITDEESFDEYCKSQNLCVVAVLPHILDCQSKCRNEYLNLLAEAGSKRKKEYRGWVWSEASAQPELESALNIGGFGYPALAVVNFKKEIYVILKGPFSESGLDEFFNSINFKKAITEPLRKEISIADTPKWDGKDGQLITSDEL
uniref:protein disulfide-isomerase n=1 Tax=Cuerna arida TaxID=1464854 RepID=A0A1B6F3M5_9HEMI